MVTWEESIKKVIKWEERIKKLAIKQVEWPNGARCAVMLSFDVDGAILPLFLDPQNKDRPVELSWGSYGPIYAAPRLLDILDNYNIKATWFFCGLMAEIHPDLVKDVHKRGHEVGAHTYKHQSSEFLSREEEREEIEKVTSVIEKLTGEKPLGYRPTMQPSLNTYKLLIDNGYLYESGLKGMDFPHRLEIDGKKTDLIDLPVFMDLDDACYFICGGSFAAYAGESKGVVGLWGRMPSSHQVYEIWKNEFDAVRKYGVFYDLVMHPQLIGRPGHALMLERLIQYMKKFPDVWFARGIDIAKYWLEKY